MDAGKKQRATKLNPTELIRLTSAAMCAKIGLTILAASIKSLVLIVGMFGATCNGSRFARQAGRLLESRA